MYKSGNYLLFYSTWKQKYVEAVKWGGLRDQANTYNKKSFASPHCISLGTANWKKTVNISSSMHRYSQKRHICFFSFRSKDLLEKKNSQLKKKHLLKLWITINITFSSTTIHLLRQGYNFNLFGMLLIHVCPSSRTFQSSNLDLNQVPTTVQYDVDLVGQYQLAGLFPDKAAHKWELA